MAGTRRRRGLLLGGAGLIAVGLALLAYVAWQLIGTNIVSERQRAAVVEETLSDWRTLPADQVEPGLGEATALVRIPRFGDGYLVPVLEGVGDDALDVGFGHFEDSADPGAIGNYALAGHRITHGQPLRDLPSLEPGDEVVVETRDTVYTYELDTDAGELEVDDDAGWVVAPHPVGTTATRLITLVTCAELFHTDERLVVFGHLVSAAPR